MSARAGLRVRDQTRVILTELGHGAGEIARLRHKGVLRS
jgi:hypothetical protein